MGRARVRHRPRVPAIEQDRQRNADTSSGRRADRTTRSAPPDRRDAAGGSRPPCRPRDSRGEKRRWGASWAGCDISQKASARYPRHQPPLRVHLMPSSRVYGPGRRTGGGGDQRHGGQSSRHLARLSRSRDTRNRAGRAFRLVPPPYRSTPTPQPAPPRRTPMRPPLHPCPCGCTTMASPLCIDTWVGPDCAAHRND